MRTDNSEIQSADREERAILLRLVLPGDSDAEIEESLEEMGRLAWTAGARVVLTLVQRRTEPCPATLVGRGKVDQLKAAVDELEADLVLVDSDLTPTQGAKLQDITGVKVLDRTQLILDIFGQRARTLEGKHQVELARLQYALPRLRGKGIELMRQVGGIGVRGGPGEQKLEVDRRVIRERIRRLQRELTRIQQHRRTQRQKRVNVPVFQVSLVGYTNAGKSTLLNALTRGGAFVEDKLFATLDPVSRKCRMASGQDVVLTDTVGFIRKLPHSLVAAFRATLEEVAEADLLLLVADAAHPAVEDHIRSVHDVLEEIDAAGKPMIYVFNKADAAPADAAHHLANRYTPAVVVSARTGLGLDALQSQIEHAMTPTRRRVRLRIPQARAGLVARVHETGRVIALAYDGNDVVVDAEVGAALEEQLKDYVA